MTGPYTLDLPWSAIDLTTHGKRDHQIKNNQRALDIPVDFVSFHVSDLPCPFVKTARASCLPVITWTVRAAQARDLTTKYADQMTFVGFDANDLRPCLRDIDKAHGR